MFSRFNMVPFDCPAHSLQEIVLPQTSGTDGSRDSVGVHFASLESMTKHLADIAPGMCRN